MRYDVEIPLRVRLHIALRRHQLRQSLVVVEQLLTRSTLRHQGGRLFLAVAGGAMRREQLLAPRRLVTRKQSAFETRRLCCGMARQRKPAHRQQTSKPHQNPLAIMAISRRFAGEANVAAS